MAGSSPLTPTDGLEATVYREFAAVVLLISGALLAISNLLGLWASRASAGSCTFETNNYLAGVLIRSLTSPYQLALLAGLLAVPLHLTWMYYGRWTRDGRAAYSACAGWSQTLFTSLGFLGTIVGVSMAVSGLDAAMSDGQPAGLICGLATAFDTTFLGLTASILLLLTRRMVNLVDGAL